MAEANTSYRLNLHSLKSTYARKIIGIDEKDKKLKYYIALGIACYFALGIAIEKGRAFLNINNNFFGYFMQSWNI